MSYNEHEGRPRRQGSRPAGGSSRPRSGGSRQRISPQAPYHGPRGTRQRSSAPRRSSGPGYPLRARSINFQSGRARRVSSNRRLLVLGIVALVIVIVLVLLVSSCVRGCSSQEPAETNPVDARVAAGVGEDLTRQFSVELDRGDKLAQIAANADAYQNQGLLELALTQPDAVDFVASYPEAEKSSQPYGDAVTKGTAPELYCWDTRWGYVDYAGEPLALSGSGPVALSMAYMGLTGSTDRTAADLATLVGDQTGGDSHMSGDFLTGSALGELGLSCSTYTSNTDNLLQVLDTGTYLMVEAQAGTLTDEAHWVLVTAKQDDGSVTVLDPTSPEVSSHEWDPGTIASSCNTLYALSLADSGGESSE